MGGPEVKATGHHDRVRSVDIVLAVGAALIQLLIREAVLVWPRPA
jgi:hypothetical protein